MTWPRYSGEYPAKPVLNHVCPKGLQRGPVLDPGVGGQIRLFRFFPYCGSDAARTYDDDVDNLALKGPRLIECVASNSILRVVFQLLQKGSVDR